MRKKKFLALLLTTGLMISSEGANVVSVKATESNTEVSTEVSESSENELSYVFMALSEGVISSNLPTQYNSSVDTVVDFSKIELKEGYCIDRITVTFGEDALVGPEDGSLVTGDTYTIPKGTEGKVKFWIQIFPVNYNITYNLNDGTNNNSNPSYYNIKNEITFKDPLKLGYDFIGWINKETGKYVTSTSDLCRDLELIAVWKEQENPDTDVQTEYSITYQVPSEFANAFVKDYNPHIYNILKGAIITAREIQLKPGYIVEGLISPGIADQPVQELVIPQGTTGDIVVQLVCKYQVYTISYDLDGGINSENNPTTRTLADNVVIEDPTKEGYRFVKWVVVGNSVEMDYDSDMWVAPGDNHLVAKWEKIENSNSESTTQEVVTTEIPTTELTTKQSTTQISDVSKTEESTTEVVQATEAVTTETPKEGLTTEVDTTSPTTESSIKSISTEKVTSSTSVRSKLDVPKVSKVVKVNNGFKLSLKKAKVGKYQIKVSTAKTFKKNTKTYKTSKKVYTIKKLKKGKVYYVKVRLYNVGSNGKVYYGKWGKVKKVKVTK